MQQNRSRVVWFIAIGLAFFFLVDPFRLFESNNIPQMRVNSDIAAEMEDYIASAPDATRYVADSLDDHDLVMIGETGYVKQQLEFLADLIPALDARGVHLLGFQYANADNQDLVDELLTGTSFDEALANRILFEHMVVMGYEEHRNVFRAAWQVNRSKGAGDEPFRIIALGTPVDYTLIQSQDDTTKPEILAQLFANGVPDELMAERIRSEIIEPGRKGVVYTQAEHAFTRFEQTQYTATMNERGFPEQRRAGNLLFSEYRDRVMSVFIHGPLQDTRSRIGYGYPIGGVMERAMENLPEGRTTVGFDVAPSPYADAPITSDTLTEGLEEDLTLQQFTDGYVYLGPIASYTPVTPIPGFINEENIQQAIADFPGPSPGEVSVAEMSEFISGTAAQMQRIFDEFD